jgi:hypothetical protein
MVSKMATLKKAVTKILLKVERRGRPLGPTVNNDRIATLSKSPKTPRGFLGMLRRIA